MANDNTAALRLRASDVADYSENSSPASTQITYGSQIVVSGCRLQI